MTKVRLIHASGLRYEGDTAAKNTLEDAINRFGSTHKIQNVSISSAIRENLYTYIAAVIYEE